ncbi:hypothetical protein PENSPDRAFT_651904 [Peniophora sp. CONT]|nr:hypothetical protein PENSPDRAFT_651904 [Peniophora sp. CONT]
MAHARSSYNAPSPPLWMLPNFCRFPLRVLPALTAGPKARSYIPSTLTRSRNKIPMAAIVESTNVSFPSSSSTASTSSSDELDSTSIKSKVAQKIAAQEAQLAASRTHSQSRARTPLRQRVANKLYVSTPSSSGSRFNVQSLRAALAAPILAVLGTTAPETKPKRSTIPASSSSTSSYRSDPTASCALGQNVFLTRSMPNQLPPTLIWSSATWGNWSTVESRYVVHILSGPEALRAYGERSYRGKLPPAKRHFIPSPESEGEEGTHVLRLVPQPQNHGGESALSVKQIAEALAFVWDAWEEAEELQRLSEDKGRVELPAVLFAAPPGQETDASLAALALAYRKTLSGGAGRRRSAYALWQEMVDDEDGVPAEWKAALALLGWQDIEFVEGMWPKAAEKTDIA